MAMQIHFYPFGSSFGPAPKVVAKRQLPTRCVAESKRRAAKRYFESQIGYKAVAARLGLSAHTVRDWLREFKKGTFSVKVNPRILSYTSETKRSVIELRRAGVSWKKIAAQTGVNISTCRSWVQNAEAAQADKSGASGRAEDSSLVALPRDDARAR